MLLQRRKNKPLLHLGQAIDPLEQSTLNLKHQMVKLLEEWASPESALYYQEKESLPTGNAWQREIDQEALAEILLIDDMIKRNELFLKQVGKRKIGERYDRKV